MNANEAKICALMSTFPEIRRFFYTIHAQIRARAEWGKTSAIIQISTRAEPAILYCLELEGFKVSEEFDDESESRVLNISWDMGEWDLNYYNAYKGSVIDKI